MSTVEYGRNTGVRTMLNKVPEATLYFWIINIMATTVGESAADYLNETLGFGLTVTTIVMSAVLVVMLVHRGLLSPPDAYPSYEELRTLR